MRVQGASTKIQVSSVLAIMFLHMAQSAFAAAPTLTSIYSFQGGADGSGPSAGLVADQAGNLYGVTYDGGVPNCGAPLKPIYCGTVFELTPPALGQGQWTKTILHTFTSPTASDGVQPVGGLAIDKLGNLYGTTSGGVESGAGGNGVVFSLMPPQEGSNAWIFTALYTFSDQFGRRDAAIPTARLLLDGKGNLYGTTITGYDGATVFELIKPAVGETNWTEQILYNFSTNFFVPGNVATAGLVADSSDNLYSVKYALGGGDTIFKLSPPLKKTKPWTYSDVVSFYGQNGIGYTPTGELSIDSAGVIYGTTKDGGSQTDQAGAVYALTPPPAGQTGWSANAIHSFSKSDNNGAYPYSGVVADKFGDLYGSTAGFGTVNQIARGHGATLFKLTPPAPGGTTWPAKKLAAFNGANGADPMSSLTLSRDGKLYGTSAEGGTYGYGAIFQLSR